MDVNGVTGDVIVPGELTLKFVPPGIRIDVPSGLTSSAMDPIGVRTISPGRT